MSPVRSNDQGGTGICVAIEHVVEVGAPCVAATAGKVTLSGRDRYAKGHRIEDDILTIDAHHWTVAIACCVLGRYECAVRVNVIDSRDVEWCFPSDRGCCEMRYQECNSEESNGKE